MPEAGSFFFLFSLKDSPGEGAPVVLRQHRDKGGHNGPLAMQSLHTPQHTLLPAPSIHPGPLVRALVKCGPVNRAFAGNQLLDKLVGARLRMIHPREFVRRAELSEQLAEDLRNEGKRPYVIPVGGSNVVGLWGCLDLVRCAWRCSLRERQGCTPSPTLQCGHLSGPSCTIGGFFDFEVGGHDGAYKGRVHVIVPFVGRKNGKLFDRQQSYNVLVLRVPGLEEGLMFGGKAL